MLPCAPSGAAHLAPMAEAASSMTPVSASGPITHGAMATLVTPIAWSCAACCSMLGALSSEAGRTGSVSRAASSTAVTLAMPTASWPPTLTTMIPSADVVMLNMRTQSARASPASASRMCSASASSALVLTTSATQAFAPLAAMASFSAVMTAGCGPVISGITTAANASGRLAAASATTLLTSATFASWTSSAGLSRLRIVAISLAGPPSASSLPLGTARISAGDPSGRLAGTARRCRPPGCTSRAVGWRTGKPELDRRGGSAPCWALTSAGPSAA